MSKSLRRTIVAVTVIAVLAYLGAKLYIHRQAEVALRELSYAMRDVAHLEYGDLDTGLDGTLTLQDVTLRPAQIQGEVFASSLTVDAGGLDALFQVRRQLADGRLPGSLTARIKGLRLNFNSALFRRLQDWTGGLLMGSPLDALACGGITHLGATEYSDMGYPYLDADARIKLNRGRDQRAALVSWDVDTTDVAHIRGEAVLRSVTPPLTLAAVGAMQLKLGSLDLDYQDQGYFDARNYYCAAQRNDTVPVFLDDHIKAVSRFLRDHGAVPSDPLLNAYRRLISSPGNEVHLALHPDSPAPLAKLPDMDRTQLVTALAPTVAINGRALKDASFKWVEPAAEVAQHAEGKQGPRRARYYPADPDALVELVGSFARVTTFDGTVHEGLIQEADGSRITMQRRFQGGDMRFGVDRADIKSVAVYRQNPLPPALRPHPQSDEAPAGQRDTPPDELPEAAKPASGIQADRQPANDGVATPEATAPDGNAAQ